MADKEEQAKGPFEKWLNAAKILAILVGVGISIWQARAANTKSDATEKSAKRVTNANAETIEAAVRELYARLGRLEGLQEARGGGGMALSSVGAVRFSEPELRYKRKRPMRATRAPAQATPASPDAGPPAPDMRPDKPARKLPDPVKFQLKRMVQEQIQFQE